MFHYNLLYMRATESMRQYLSNILIITAFILSGCSSLGCYKEEYLYEGSQFAIGYISVATKPYVIEHRKTMASLGDELFDSKEAMLEAGYMILSCNVTPQNVHYCEGIKQIRELRVREVCPSYNSLCKDGTSSSSQGRGTCSHHGGVI